MLPPRLKNFVKRRLGYPMPQPTLFVMPVATTTPTKSTCKPVIEHVLPRLFTPSTGPEQVWPLPECAVDWAKELGPTVDCLKARGKTRVLLAFREPIAPSVFASAEAQGLCVRGYLQIAAPGENKIASPDGKPVYLPKDLSTVTDVDAVVVLCSKDFGLAARWCESYLRNDLLFVPGSRESIVAQPVRDASPGEWAARSSILTYLQCSGLRGHFAEFGTFWGRAFYNSYYELNHWLQGKFFAFDSFAGLSEPDPRELNYTNGDFKKGAYGFSHDSFVALAEILGLPSARIATVPGFFDVSLNSRTASKLGITPKSLSVCRIDCDLLDPTLRVLDFVSPLLNDGALVYFDDWRLCRADSNVGERGAALRWLEKNPSFELVDFHSIHWQHQWFIFHRNRTSHASHSRIS